MVEATDLTTVYTLDELRRLILPLVENYGFRSPAIFGSYARSEATPESDIDLLVDRNGRRPMTLCAFMEDLYQATGKNVDVYDYSEISEGAFKDAIMSEAVAL